MAETRTNILVCGGTGCLASESEKVMKNLELILKARGYDKEVSVIKTGCFGFCEQGPIVKVEPDNVNLPDSEFEKTVGAHNWSFGNIRNHWRSY